MKPQHILTSGDKKHYAFAIVAILCSITDREKNHMNIVVNTDIALKEEADWRHQPNWAVLMGWTMDWWQGEVQATPHFTCLFTFVDFFRVSPTLNAKSSTYSQRLYSPPIYIIAYTDYITQHTLHQNSLIFQFSMENRCSLARCSGSHMGNPSISYSDPLSDALFIDVYNIRDLSAKFPSVEHHCPSPWMHPLPHCKLSISNN